MARGAGEMAGHYFYVDPQGQSHWEPPTTTSAASAAATTPTQQQMAVGSVNQMYGSQQQQVVQNPAYLESPQAAAAASRGAVAVPAKSEEATTPDKRKQLNDALKELKGHWIVCYGSYIAFFVAVVTMAITVESIGREYAKNAETTAELAVAMANVQALRAAREDAWEAWYNRINASQLNLTGYNLTNMTLYNISFPWNITNCSTIEEIGPNCTNGTWVEPELLDPPRAGECENQDLGHRMYIFTAIMFMASRLPPLKRVSRDYRVRQMMAKNRLPKPLGETALADAEHESAQKRLWTLISELRASRRALLNTAGITKDKRDEYVALKELTKSKFHRWSSRLAAIVAAFTMVVLVVNGAGQQDITQVAFGSEITGELEYFNRSSSGEILPAPGVRGNYLGHKYMVRPQGADEFIPDINAGDATERDATDLVEQERECPTGYTKVGMFRSGGRASPDAMADVAGMVEYTACEDFDDPGSELVLQPTVPKLHNCLVSIEDQQSAMSWYVLTAFLFMATQCQRVVFLVRDWWVDELCWRSTPFTIISLLLSTGLVLHSVGWAMERARVEVVVASLACIFFLAREAVHTVVDAKVVNPDAAAGLHYVLVRNLYSILLFAISVLLVLHAIWTVPSYWGSAIEPFIQPVVPPPPLNPTPVQLQEYINQIQEANVQNDINRMENEEAGPVDVLSLLLSSFFVLCAAEWMAEMEHDHVDAARFNTEDAVAFVDGVRDLAPATIFHGVCVVCMGRGQ